MRPPSASPPSDESAGEHSAPRLERLQKVLAAAGVDSRRHCEELISTGRVTVDGKVVTELGFKVDADRQRICLDGEKIKPERKQYFLVNKPKGYLCTNDDPAGRPRAVDLLPPQAGRVFTVGRLDENTEGLLLLTNDGEIAQRLAHPRFQVERVYRVQVAGDPAGEVFDRLKEGYYFTEGKFRVRDIRRLGRQGQSTILQIILTEGQNREVRRLLARVGHKVLNLKRIAFGPLKLADLETGAYRKLNGVEVAELHRMAEGRPARKFTRPPGARPKVAKKSSAHIRSVKAAAAERSPGAAVGTARPATKRPMRPETSAGRPATTRPTASKPTTAKPATAKKKVARSRSDRPAPRGTKGSAKGGGRSR